MKNGKLYVTFLSLFMVVLLIYSYVEIAHYFNQNKSEVHHTIGEKQGDILAAVKEGERILLYTEQATILAGLDTAEKSPCGQPYLRRSLLGKGECEDFHVGGQAALTQYLAQYPGGALSDITWEEEAGADGALTLHGVKEIKIVTKKERETVAAGEPNPMLPSSGTLSGQFAFWPAEGDIAAGLTNGLPTAQEHDQRINSPFGDRYAAGQATNPRECSSPTRNHGGWDIHVPDGKAGEKVFSLTTGRARYIDTNGDHSDGGYNYVLVEAPNGLLMYYLHTKPAGKVTQEGWVDVQPGEVIAVTSGAIAHPHLHLQIGVKGVTEEVVRAAFQPTPSADGRTVRHVYRTCEHSPDSSIRTYATISGHGTVTLDPICFFDREFVTPIIERSFSPSDRRDKYVRLIGADGKVLTAADNNAFEACDAYEQKLHLSERLGWNAETETPVETPPPIETQPAAEPTTPTPTPAVDTTPITFTDNQRERFETAQRNMQPYMADVQKAATEYGVPAELLLAVITQESAGKADARSPTGPIGVAQFQADTAKLFFDEADKGKIQSCCRAGSTTCTDPPTCRDKTDPRFDPVKSVRAEARYYHDLLEKYQGYDQQVAFAVAEYNAGGAITALVRETGKEQPTWEDVEAEMERSTRLTAKKETEVKGYVHSVLLYYQAWGGHTIAATEYTTDEIGTYKLNIVIPDVKPSPFADTVQAVHEKVQTCETQTCIRETLQHVSVETQGAIIATEVPFTTQDSCVAPVEQAQAHLASAFSWCLASPDTNCGCPLPAGFTATYSINEWQTALLTLNGEPVITPPMTGFGEEDPDTEEGFPVTLYEEGVLQALDPTVTLTMTPQGITLPGGFMGGGIPVTALYKTPQGISFTNDAVEQCVMPPKPVPYCMRSGESKLAFYVDMQAHSTPTETAETLKEVKSEQLGEYVRITFTSDTSYPYVYAQVGAPVTVDEYLNVHTGFEGQALAENQLTQAQRGIYYVVELTENGKTTYQTILPAQGRIALQFMDENLQKTPTPRVIDAVYDNDATDELISPLSTQ
jgi:soluble lytic murein transglycosylase-like protein/murein DD-endopeptidase MepM/ murein hydrolase activator NlpD